jgi:hypothetical protein
MTTLLGSVLAVVVCKRCCVFLSIAARRAVRLIVYIILGKSEGHCAVIACANGQCVWLISSASWKVSRIYKPSVSEHERRQNDQPEPDRKEAIM